MIDLAPNLFAGNLNTEINRRMLVPNHIWKVLTKYFENARAFTYDSQICKQCQVSKMFVVIFIRIFDFTHFEEMSIMTLYLNLYFKCICYRVANRPRIPRNA